MKNSIIIFIFIFINYFNPISIYLTLLIDICLCLYLGVNKGNAEIKSIKLDKTVFFIVLGVLIWAFIVFILRAHFEMFVIGKYIRVTISTILLMLICTQLKATAGMIIPVLSFIFLLHILAVGLQNIFPQLDIPMAKIFGFERETDLISDMTIRKLGLSSSYDTAALISLSGMTFFFILFTAREKIIDLFFSFFALATTIRISRTGMALGIILFAIFLIYLFFKLKGGKKLFALVFLAFGAIGTIYIVLPILAASTVSFLVETQFNNGDIASSDYSNGSVTSLTDSHLNAIKVPSIWDLLIGFGLDPNTVVGMNTDIGYIKLVWHVGIVGLFMVMGLYAYIFRKALWFRKNTDKNSDENILASFIALYLILIIIINYKSLEIYSRGGHDLLLILFLCLMFTGKRKIIESTAFKSKFPLKNI